MEIIEANNKEITDLCRKYAVKELYLFGSALRQNFRSGCDIDLAVVFSRKGIEGSFDQYFNLKMELEQLLGRSVDLVCSASIRNSILRRELDKTKKLIYAA